MTPSKKYTNLLKDTLIFTLGNVGSKVIVFFLVPFYTYYLTPEEYGISDLVFTISQLAIPFFSLVIFDAVIRFALYRKELPQDTLLVGVIVWFLGSVLAFAAAPLIGLYRPMSDWKWYIVAYMSINMLVSIEMNYLKAIDKNLVYSIICILQTLALAVLNIILVAHVKLGIRGYLISYIGSNAIAALLAMTFGRLVTALRNAAFDSQLAKEMIVYSSPLIINNVSWWVIQSSDKLMLEEMVSESALGIYTVASRIPSLITVFITIFQQAWGISAVREYESSNDKTYYATVLRYLFLFISGACIVFVAFMKVFMNHYVGKDFLDAWHYVPLLLVSAVFAGVAGYFGSMYSALKKSVNNMLSTATAALVNLIVNWIFIPITGIWGAVIGTLVAYITIAFVRLFDVKRFVTIDIRWPSFLFTMAIIIVQAVFVSLDIHIYAVSLLAAAAYLLINFKDIRELMEQLLSRLKH